MTWLSPEDREEAKRIEESGRASFARASGNNSFVQVSLRVNRQYPYPPESKKLDFPRAMSENDAYAYLCTIAHDRSSVEGFYCKQGFYHQVRRY